MKREEGTKKAFAEELEEECMEPGSNPFLKIMPTRPGSRLKRSFETKVAFTSRAYHYMYHYHTLAHYIMIACHLFRNQFPVICTCVASMPCKVPCPYSPIGIGPQ